MNRSIRRRGALTLLELIVVLLILIGLAGILIPMMPNMLGRTHNSTGATNMQEISKWIQSFEQIDFQYPDEWDAITDGTDLVTYLPKDAGGVPVAGDLTADTLTPEEVVALQTAGIRNVHKMALTNPNSPTFDPYTAALPTAIDDTIKLAFLSPQKAYEQLGQSKTGKYLAVGLGQRCTMIGRVVGEAPVLFADEPSINPTKAYVRFAVIFKVSDNGKALSRATLCGALHIAKEGLHGANAHIQEYYQVNGNK